jgi:membrane protein implicated in regulation of membrane protease activity
VSAVTAWLVAAGVGLIIEVVTLDFIFIMLSVGAVAAALAAVLGAEVGLQVLTFVVVSLIGLFALRPLALRRLRPPETVTNIDRLVGHRALVLEPVDHLGGRVKIGGEVWSAKLESTTAAALAVGTYVTVQRIEGATAVVLAVEPTQQPVSPPEAEA